MISTVGDHAHKRDDDALLELISREARQDVLEPLGPSFLLYASRAERGFDGMPIRHSSATTTLL